MKYNFKKMTDTAILPTRHTPVSAGVDFYSDQDVEIPPGESAVISTGISWNPVWFPIHIQEADSGYTTTANISLIIQSRSGLAFKQDIEASNAGVIDQDFTPHGDEKAIIHVKLYNHSKKWFSVKRGDKIAQGVPNLIPYFDDVQSLDDDRQGKGFGSSDGKEGKAWK